jgi:hypothetical protein
VNVCIAGGYALTEAAGADLVGQMVNGLFNLPVDYDLLTYRTGVFVTNYLKTLRVGDVAELGDHRHPEGSHRMTTATTPDAGRNASPYLYGEETAAAARVLEGGQYGHTEVSEEFEHRITAFLRVRDAEAVISATPAPHTALLAADAGPRPRGGRAAHDVLRERVQATLATGATPVFADIDPATPCVTDQLVTDTVTDRTRAVMPACSAAGPPSPASARSRPPGTSPS